MWVVLTTILSDLNPYDCFLRGFLKDTVYKINQHTIKELQQEILAAVISVSKETLAAVVRNYRRRLQTVLDADGAYIENVFT
jgi:adenine deaminase